MDSPTLSLYGAIAEAETGGESNPWIRTKYAPAQGSSAFGPVQITGTKVRDYADRGILSPESAEFANEQYLPMTDTFLKYGNEPDLEGFDPAFDYGGSGNFTEEQQADYQKMADEMLAYDYLMNNGDIDGFIKSWRGTADDERYNNIVKKKLEHLKSK